MCKQGFQKGNWILAALACLKSCQPNNGSSWLHARSLSTAKFIFCFLLLFFSCKSSSPLLRLYFLLSQCCFPLSGRFKSWASPVSICFAQQNTVQAASLQRGSIRFSLRVYPDSVLFVLQEGSLLAWELLRKRCFTLALLFPQEWPQM